MTVFYWDVIAIPHQNRSQTDIDFLPPSTPHHHTHTHTHTHTLQRGMRPVDYAETSGTKETVKVLHSAALVRSCYIPSITYDKINGKSCFQQMSLVINSACMLLVHCGLSICENVHWVQDMHVACGMPSTPTEYTQTVELDVFIVWL